MDFQYDIFISYGKSENPDPQKDQWIAGFSGYLSSILERMNHRKLTFLSHDDLRKEQIINREIFSETAVFVTILSPESVQSSEYLKDIEEIYKTVYSKTSREVNRIFKVLTGPLSSEQQPDSMQNEISYDFFEVNRFSKKARILEISPDSGPEEKCMAKLVDLAYDIQSALNLMGSDNSKKNEKLVYLAETTIDQYDNRDIIRRELQNLNAGIFPLVNLPNDGEEIERIVTGYLSRSSLSIHIMGSIYGDFVKNSKYSIIDLQNRIVKDYLEKTRGENRLKRIIWIPGDVKHSEQRQSLFLNRLKRDDTLENTEIIEAPAELFKTILKARVSEIGKKTASANGLKKIYLIYEKNGIQTVDDLKEIIKRKGFDVIAPNLSLQEKNCITRHKENLVQAEAVIIYRGNSSMNWLNSKILDLVKAPGFGKQDRFKTVGIISEEGFDQSVFGRFMPETHIITSATLKVSFIDEFFNKITEHHYAR